MPQHVGRQPVGHTDGLAVLAHHRPCSLSGEPSTSCIEEHRDLIVATEEAKLGLPEAKVGVAPVVILPPLLRAVPRAVLVALVANALLLSLSGSGQVQPGYWLNPKVGIQYLVNIRAPEHAMHAIDRLREIPVSPGTPGEGDGQTPPMGHEYWYPLYEKLCELDVVAHIHNTGSLRQREPYTLQFINEETTAIYGLLRVTYDLLPAIHWEWGLLVLVIAVVTTLFGVLFALMQHDLKRLLAYHSVENIGIIFAALGLALAFRTYGMGVAAALALSLGLSALSLLAALAAQHGTPRG